MSKRNDSAADRLKEHPGGWRVPEGVKFEQPNEQGMPTSTWEERMTANRVRRERARIAALECTCPEPYESGKCEKHGITQIVNDVYSEPRPDDWPPPQPMAAPVTAPEPIERTAP